MWWKNKVCFFPDGGDGGGAGNPPAGNPPAGGVATVTPEALNSLQGDQFHALFPEDIRGKGYMKDVKTFGDFVKKFDGAQSYLGQVFPRPDAPAEQWDAFLAKAGRPDKPEAYAVPDIDGVPKEFVQKATEIGVFQKAMHEAGILPVQANRFLPAVIKAIFTAEQAEAQESEKAHKVLMDSTFGKDFALVKENGQKFLAAHVPANVKPLLGQLDDKAWAVVLAMTDAVAKKYVAEDGLRKPGAGGSGTGSAETVESIQGKMSAIMAQKEYQDPFVNRAKNAELVAQMDDLRKKLRDISGQRK